jgi:hypothetical protein
MNILNKMRNTYRRQIVQANASIYDISERNLLLQAHSFAKNNRTKTLLSDLSAVEFRASSQWGEDGIIDWLVERLPSIPKTFIEFGVEDYRQSNTRLLLQLRNWQGLVMDGSSEHIQNIHKQEIYWRYELEAKCAFIDRDNINKLIKDAGFIGEIGLLSIDIDGNDYWVWQALDVVQPAIVVCEYNAVFGDNYALTVPYKPDFQRTQAHHSNLYFGASIRALIKLGQQKGYQFVGTSSTGCNAFFVRNDLAPIIQNSLECISAYPSSVREARDMDGQLLFTSGAQRSKIIDHLPLIDLQKNSETTLADCSNLYSSEWASRRKLSL